MHIISKASIRLAMRQHPRWKPGLSLWLKIFGSKEFRFQSYQDLRHTWKSISGWNVDRIPGATVRETFGGSAQRRTLYSDVYVFDIHGTECRLVCRFVEPDRLYIRLIGSHTGYDKWWKDHTGYKRKHK